MVHLLAEQSVTDLIMLLGHDDIVSMTLNVAEVHAPGGTALTPLARPTNQ
ncbi:MAG: hypothetical protein ACRYHQ_03290 [Janthinobacterium lividum]